MSNNSVLISIIIPAIISMAVSFVVTKNKEQTVHQTKLKFDTYFNFIDVFCRIFLNKDTPEEIDKNQKELIKLFSIITLIANENVAKETLNLRLMITQKKDAQDLILELELQLAKIKNEMRKDLGLDKFIDLRNGFSLFATEGISKDIQADDIIKKSSMLYKIFNNEK